MKHPVKASMILVSIIIGLGVGTISAHAQTNARFGHPSEQQESESTIQKREFEDKGDYYILNTGEKSSFLRRKKTYVLINETGKQATLTALSPKDIQAQFETQVDIVKHSLGKFVMVKIKEGQDPEAVLSRLRSADSTISFISPVLTSVKLGGELAVLPRLVVKITDTANPDDVMAELKTYKLSLVSKLSFTETEYELKIDGSVSDIGEIFQLTRTVAALPNIQWAEPNFLVSPTKFFTPNDPLYPNQWHLNNTGQNSGALPDADIDAPEGWDIHRGTGAVIAVYDDGVDLAHEDLVIWSNPGESIPEEKKTNGIDDDGNGYIDDYRGWDFLGNDNNPSPGSSDNHGTACAGVAGAHGNNGIGVCGSALEAEILPLRAGSTCTAHANGIRYGGKYADVVSNSWGIGACQSEIDSAVSDAVNGNIPGARRGTKGTPVLFATGNAASGWVRFTLTGFPAGTYSFRWEFSKDGSVSEGYDTVWLDNITWPGGATTNFESDTVGAVPSGFTSGGAANWTVVSDGTHAWGASGKSVKAGTITHSQETNLYATRAVGSGTLYYWAWVSSELYFDYFFFYVDGNLYHAWTPGQYAGHTNSVGYPASNADTIAVGASNDGIGGLEQRSDYSQFGPELDVLAPSSSSSGYGITTTDRMGSVGYATGNYTSDFGGTSSATPLAAGVAAVMIACNPSLTEAQVLSALRLGTDKIGPYTYSGGRNDYYGYGRVNLKNSLDNVCGSSSNSYLLWTK